MKLIIQDDCTYEDLNFFKLNTFLEYYEKFYKDNKDEILFDEGAEAIYYEIDVQQLPMEGQRVGTKFGTCIVTYSYYNLIGEPLIGETDFFYKNRILVREE